MNDLAPLILARMRERGAERAHSPRDVALHGGAFLDTRGVWRCLEDLADDGAVVPMAGDKYRLAEVQRGGEQMTIGG